MMKILVIIPAYNEELNIKKVVDNLVRNFSQYDYLIVNDGSSDNTQKICKENNYNYISLPNNLGIGGGMQTGYQYAVQEDYDIAIQYDGDGQHNAEYIENLIKPIINGEANMIIGSRFIENEGFRTSFMRRLGINILKCVIKICTNVWITDATSGFRATDKKLTKFYSEHYAQDYPEPEAIVEALVHRFKIKEVPVIMNERIGGVSSINSIKSVYYMIKVSLAIVICRISRKED